MELSRRQFLKLGGATSALLASHGYAAPVTATPRSEVKWTKETATICPYCAVGCGIIVGTRDGQVVNTPMYRAPGASEWQEVEWDWALDEIANRVKGTRDANWIETEADGRLVRRTEAIASVGSAALDNEECILLVKALRSMGLVYIEHQARI
jgi:formate dehydrogenase major subunit